MRRHNSPCFIILNYHPNKKILDALISSLAGSNVIVVDNSKKNYGYGGGANEGLRKALGQDMEWAVVMNQDLRITKKGIEELEKMLEKSEPGTVGPFAGRLDSWRWTTILPSNKVDYISGSCIAIHRDVIKNIGYFYEPYFLYYEDADYCVRAKKAGFPLKKVAVSGFHHEESTSLGRGSVAHEYYLSRNHLLFVERNAPALVKLHEYLRLPKTVAEHLRHRNWGALLGLKDYFLRRFGIFKR